MVDLFHFFSASISFWMLFLSLHTFSNLQVVNLTRPDSRMRPRLVVFFNHLCVFLFPSLSRLSVVTGDMRHSKVNKRAWPGIFRQKINWLGGQRGGNLRRRRWPAHLRLLTPAHSNTRAATRWILHNSTTRGVRPTGNHRRHHRLAR